MYFSKSRQGSKLAVSMQPISIESTLLLLILELTWFKLRCLTKILAINSEIQILNLLK